MFSWMQIPRTPQHEYGQAGGTCGWHRGIAAETAWVQLLWWFEPLGSQDNGSLICATSKKRDHWQGCNRIIPGRVNGWEPYGKPLVYGNIPVFIMDLDDLSRPHIATSLNCMVDTRNYPNIVFHFCIFLWIIDSCRFIHWILSSSYPHHIVIPFLVGSISIFFMVGLKKWMKQFPQLSEDELNIIS